MPKAKQFYKNDLLENGDETDVVLPLTLNGNDIIAKRTDGKMSFERKKTVNYLNAVFF